MIQIPLSALEKIIRQCRSAASGDLEARINGLCDHPGIGELASAINGMLDVADSFVRESAAAMSHCSQDQFHRPILLRGLPGAYRQSAAIINQAGLQMSQSSEQLKMVAEMADENTRSIASVAAACEELQSTSSEIALQAGESTSRTNHTVEEATDTQRGVESLSQGVEKIDEIIVLIKKVSEQTDLLALNATIQAARAGDRGKGFAVVANEVKELSRETAQSTDNIRQQVNQVKSEVQQNADRVRGITDSIGDVDQFMTSIKIAVEDQVKATQEIARSIQQLSENTSRVGELIQRSTLN